jgi:LuxR family transcriptional regulator, maltose regulon positive regulatory protein
VRLFADEGQPMARLLAQVAASTMASPSYLHQLQAALLPARQAVPNATRTTPPQALIDPLSAREREVLALLASGYSNQQIAYQLVISLNTAKRHVKHLLAKLVATNRTQAVARARDLHLL